MVSALIDARSRASSDVLTSLDRLAQGLAQGVARTADGLHVARSLDGDVVKAAAALSESWRALLAGTLTVPASMSTTTTTTTTTLTAVATKETAKTPDASQFLDKQVVASERATIAFVPPQSVVIDIVRQDKKILFVVG